MVNVNNSFVANPPIDDGVLFNAPLGTELPTDALMALDEAFKDLGAVGENGIAINKTRTTQKTRRFGGKVFRTVQTEADHSVVITLLEDDNVDVLKVINGEANVVVHEPDDKGLKKTIYHSLDPLPIESWVIECVDGDKEKRYVIEKGQITEIAEVVDTHTDVTKYQITIETYENSLGTRGENVVEFRNDAAQATEGP